MTGKPARAGLGFIAAALSVLIVHQGVVYILGKYGLARGTPWDMRPLGYGPVAAIPILLNNMFWGGLWGVLFALIFGWLPGSWSWLKGLIFGVLVVIFSNWILRPLILQHIFGYPPQPLFAGFNGSNPMVLLPSFLILTGFGLGLGLIYGLIRPKAE